MNKYADIDHVVVISQVGFCLFTGGRPFDWDPLDKPVYPHRVLPGFVIEGAVDLRWRACPGDCQARFIGAGRPAD